MSQWWTEGWVQAAAALLAVFISFLSLLFSLSGERHRQEWEERQRQREREWQEQQAQKNRDFQRELVQERMNPQARVAITTPLNYSDLETVPGYSPPERTVTSTITNVGQVDIYLKSVNIRMTTDILPDELKSAVFLDEFGMYLSSYVFQSETDFGTVELDDNDSSVIRPGMSRSVTLPFKRAIQGGGRRRMGLAQRIEAAHKLDRELNRDDFRFEIVIRSTWESQAGHIWSTDYEIVDKHRQTRLKALRDLERGIIRM